MPSTHDQRIENAIHAIEAFLSAEPEISRPGSSQIHELSLRIQQARSARHKNDWNLSDPEQEALHSRYQGALQKLRARLAELENSLVSERDHCLEEQAHQLRLRQWHHSFSRTQ